MHVVAVIGSRHIKVNRLWVATLIQDRVATYGSELTVTSLGCNWGFGRDVKDYCKETGVKFCEFLVYIGDTRPKEEYAKLQTARHAALMEVVDEFYIATPGTEHTADLVRRVTTSNKTYFIFDKDFYLTDSLVSVADCGRGFILPKFAFSETKDDANV